MKVLNWDGKKHLDIVVFVAGCFHTFSLFSRGSWS